MRSKRRNVYPTGRGMVVADNVHFLLVANDYPFVSVKRKKLSNALNEMVHSESLPEKRSDTCKMQETAYPSPKDILERIHIYIF